MNSHGENKIVPKQRFQRILENC